MDRLVPLVQLVLNGSTFSIGKLVLVVMTDTNMDLPTDTNARFSNDAITVGSFPCVFS